MSTARRLALPVLTALFLLAFYYRGLNCWFYQDDFGWLHLGPAKDFRDFLSILFAPKAHGNFRPWSENLFFYGLRALFGINPLPFRIVVFATYFADLLLLYAIVVKLTGSRLAAAVAQACWILNPCVAPALCWTCIYNQPQSVFFLLLAFLLFIDGRYKAQLAVFVLGLGSLETVVVYPALVSLYALLYNRPRFLSTLPLYGVSAAFTVLHFSIAPAFKSGPYAIQIDARLPHTLAAYIEMALGPERLGHFHWTWPAWAVPAGTAVMAVLILLAVYVGRRAGLLGLGWFFLPLLPLLALPTHIMDYVLTAPAIGLAIILAGAVAARRVVGLPIAVLYLAIAAPAAWDVTEWNWRRSHISRDLVLGVVDYNRAHPGKMLLLTGMDTDQFLAGFADLPFELHGMYNVLLAPGAEQNIHDEARIAPLYVMPPAKSYPLLDASKAVVLDVTGGHIRDVTAEYRKSRR